MATSLRFMDMRALAYHYPICLFGIRRRLPSIYTNTTTGAITNLAISPDGNRIVYSTSTGLYAVDRAANTNWQIAASLSVLRAGLQFSGDSRFLVYSTTDAQVALDTNGVADVYLYDFVTRSNFLVSQGNPPGAASGPSDSPVISNDGRFVAYRSTATNLVAGATNGLPNVFLYDRQTGTTTLLSANASGMAGNNRSFAPQFSGDGQTVVFQSWASDLIAQDFNQVNDLFAVRIATFIPTPPTITSQPVNQTVLVGKQRHLQRDRHGHGAVELSMEFQWDEPHRCDEHHVDTDQCAVLPGGQLCGAGDQCLWFDAQFQCTTDSGVDAARHYQSTGRPHKQCGHDGHLHRDSRRIAADELSVVEKRFRHD